MRDFYKGILVDFDWIEDIEPMCGINKKHRMVIAKVDEKTKTITIKHEQFVYSLIVWILGILCKIFRGNGTENNE